MEMLSSPRFATAMSCRESPFKSPTAIACGLRPASILRKGASNSNAAYRGAEPMQKKSGNEIFTAIRSRSIGSAFRMVRSQWTPVPAQAWIIVTAQSSARSQRPPLLEGFHQLERLF
jgi:hypothetical protein